MIWGIAGATIEDANGDKKVKEAVSAVTAHFFFEGQFLGLSGSSGPLKVTYQVCQ
jgi:hypothetical protein